MQINSIDKNNTLLYTEKKTWEFFLRLMNAKNAENKLTNKQIHVLSYILSKEPNVSYFSKPYTNEIEEGINISYSELMKIKEPLVELGLIVESKHLDDGRKKIFLPVKSIIDLQIYVKKSKFVSFYFPIQVVDDTQ